jgi:hypothetical protein
MPAAVGASSAVSWAGLQTSRWSVLLMQAATIYSRTAILWAPIAPPSACGARGACRCSPLQQPPLVRVHVEVDSLLHLHAVKIPCFQCLRHRRLAEELRRDELFGHGRQRGGDRSHEVDQLVVHLISDLTSLCSIHTPRPMRQRVRERETVAQRLSPERARGGGHVPWMPYDPRVCDVWFWDPVPVPHHPPALRTL